MLLAHQGGWDEMLMVALPVALFAGMLWMANRRAEAQLKERESERDAEPDTELETGPDPAGGPLP
jgi:hypothetical protein